MSIFKISKLLFFMSAAAVIACAAKTPQDYQIVPPAKPEDGLNVLLPEKNSIPVPDAESDPSQRTAPISTYADVQAFMAEMVEKHGIDEEVLQNTFDNTTFDYSIIAIMNRPAEKRAWSWYHDSMVSEERVAGGVKYMKTYKTALDKATKTYGVPQNVITAVIGVETTYGTAVFKRTAVQALSTLAFEYPRRAAYFKSELESLLVLADKQDVDPLYYRGSYAGAVGIPQFMPSNMTKYGKDGDGDDKIDILGNHADAIASAANFLKEHGWVSGKNTVTLAEFTKEVDDSVYSTDPCASAGFKTVKQLRALGVEIPKKFKNDEKAILVKLYDNEDEGVFSPAVFFENACPINRYNRSLKYTAAIALLAEAIEAQ